MSAHSHMIYSHKMYQGDSIEAFRYKGQGLASGKVVCVGRNYLDHVKELGNVVSEQPVLFMKPKAALCDIAEPLRIPTSHGACHNELELAFLIAEPLSNASIDECAKAICGVGLALDLTLRDLQSQLKTAGQPWERAKAFDKSCPISPFVPIDAYTETDYRFGLDINGESKQRGNANLMLHKVLPLLAHITQSFSLEPGDVLLTGTPKGVGPLRSGDKLSIFLDEHFSISTSVV